MSTWKLMGIWFVVFFGEIVFIGDFPWISILLLIGMMAYNIPRWYRAITDKSIHNLGDYYLSEFDEDDITTYRSTKDILASDRFTADEKRREYSRRGKSPSGVIDGIYNDMFLENDMYNDDYRDWEADA